jgi:hypothetical protein
MHPTFSTRGAQRRRISAAVRTPEPTCLVRLTVDASGVTALREVVSRVCGDALEFIRIATCPSPARMTVWLCVATPYLPLMVETVLRQQPNAQISRIDGAPAQVAS